MLDKIIQEKMLSAKAVIGFYPANSDGEDVMVYKNESAKEINTIFHFLRNQY